MAIPASIAAKISSPLFNIMSYMEQLVLPLNYGLGSPGGDGAETFGSAVPARRNFKPFIVGIIPPDIPVNFIPFKKTLSSVADIQGTSFPLGSSTLSSPVTSSVTVTTGNRGLDQRVSVRTPTSEIRQSVYNNFFKQTGQYPSADMVNWMTAQMMLEQGGNTSYIPSTNFNFGNTQASGGSIGGTPPTPSSGSYFLGQGSYPKPDGTQQSYSVYYHSFQNADDGVAYQVNRILTSWNGAANATDITGYRDGLLPGRPKNYFTDDPQHYLHALQYDTNALQSAIAKGQAGGVIGGPPTTDSPAFSTPTLSTQTSSSLGIMINGTTQAESDPSGDRIGKLVQYDPDRADVAKKQTDALQAQIAVLQAVPGLLLMVNPSDFTRSFEPSVDNTVKGRYGNIVHVWLERPTVVSFSGVTAGQYVVDGEGNGGITGELRTYSASYLNLLSLLSVYKTNGIIYSGPEADLGIAMLGYSVFIYFDNFIYVGSFDSFEITDSDQKPHNMAYSCRFNVRYYFDAGNDGRFTDFEIGVNNGRPLQVSR